MHTGIELVDPSTAGLERMTKAQLIEFIHAQAAFYQAVERETHNTNIERSKIQLRLNKAEERLEQARAMLDAAIDRWYEYDD